MAKTRFSPFELLLLKSRNQTDTAALLMLAWVAASKASLSESDRQRLSAISATFRHGHDVEPIFDIADHQDLEAIQLAAEVLQKDWWAEQALPFLRLAIEFAVTDGKLAAATNHILRFQADLLGVSPQQFNQLFIETIGKDLESPEDPSRADYWHARERTRQQQSHQHEQARQRSHQQQSHQQQSHQQQSHQQQSHHRQERQHSNHEQRTSGSSEQAPPTDRTLRALRILGLEANASRGEIKKAYRRLAQTHHPDRFFSLGESDVASASLRFQKIKKAYEYLMQDA